MCLYPTLIKNPKYKPNKKNGGQVPPVLDKRVLAEMKQGEKDAAVRHTRNGKTEWADHAVWCSIQLQEAISLLEDGLLEDAITVLRNVVKSSPATAHVAKGNRPEDYE